MIATELETVAAQKLTYHEFCQMEFDDNDLFQYEVLNGHLVKNPTPHIRHQFISSKVFIAAFNFIRSKNLGEILFSPVDVFLDKYNVPQPDLLFISNARLKIMDASEGIVVGAPDLVVEIISPSSIKRDRIDKKSIYERFGVAEYIVIDPNYRTVETYFLDNDRYELFHFAQDEGSLKSKILTDFELNLIDLFS